MRERNIEWWYWLATAVFLSITLLVWPALLIAVIALSGLQIVHFTLRSGGIRSLLVQVRISYLALLLAGLWRPLSFLYWVQFVGTWAVVLVDYCFLARCLSLLPWNAIGPLTVRHAVRAFLNPPSKTTLIR